MLNEKIQKNNKMVSVFFLLYEENLHTLYIKKRSNVYWNQRYMWGSISFYKFKWKKFFF